MSDNNQAIYGEPQVVELVTGDIGIGSYIVNDYLLTVTQDTNGNGYLFTIRKGSEVQTIHLTELTQEAVNSSIETALSQAKESGEFDGNGIESVVFNPDYTLSLYFTDGTSVTTGSIKGAKGDSGTGITSVVYNNDHTLTVNLTDGTSYRTDSIKGNKGDTGVGIASAELNSNHTLTIRYTDGTSYTTPSIRGEKGDKGDKGDPGDSIEFHICSSSEYNHTTMIPTVANPKATAFYLVPSSDAVTTDLFIEWVYVNGGWEKFGSATINLDSYATKTEVSAKMDKATNTGSAGQVLTSNGSGGQTWSNAAVPDWNTASGSAGFIRNKPDFKAGTGADSITNRHSLVSGSHSMATGTNNTVSGADSYATGSGNNVKSTGTLMTGSYNTAELRGSNGLVSGTSNNVSNANAIVAGNNNAVSGINSAATGNGNTASGSNSSVSGENVIANHKSQTVSGEYNVPDPSSAAATARGNYVEIIGNGTADNARSNARTLDWSGNEWVAGNFKMGGNSYDDPNAKEVATKEYVDQAIQNLLASLNQ